MGSFFHTAEEKKKVYKHKLAAEYAPHIFLNTIKLWPSNYFTTPGKKRWQISPSLPATTKFKEQNTYWSPAWHLWNVCDLSAQLSMCRVINLQQEDGRELSKEASIFVIYPGWSVTETRPERQAVGTKYIHELPLTSTGITEIFRLFIDLIGSCLPTDAFQHLSKGIFGPRHWGFCYSFWNYMSLFITSLKFLPWVRTHFILIWC